MTHGTTQKVVVSTIPAGATVSDGVNEYKTPATIELKRNQDYTLTVTKYGFVTQKVVVKREMSDVVAKDIILPFVGFLAWGVDAVSGAQWNLIPEKVAVQLQPVYAVNMNKEKKNQLLPEKDETVKE